jgi:hypothetical protein
MKKQSNTLFTKFGKEALADLTREVKETIAFGLAKPYRKIFTVADLWNIQRQSKSSIQRRYL